VTVAVTVLNNVNNVKGFHVLLNKEADMHSFCIHRLIYHSKVCPQVWCNWLYLTCTVTTCLRVTLICQDVKAWEFLVLLNKEAERTILHSSHKMYHLTLAIILNEKQHH